MSMSKKDYEFIALTLKGALEQTSMSDPGYTKAAVDRIVADMVARFKRDNPHFNPTKFELAVFGVIEL